MTSTTNSTFFYSVDEGSTASEKKKRERRKEKQKNPETKQISGCQGLGADRSMRAEGSLGTDCPPAMTKVILELD